MVFVVIIEDDVDFLCCSALIGSKHDVVFGIPIEVFLILNLGQKFDVSTTTIKLLFVFDRVLKDKGLISVGE